ncbi:amidohydrolase [Nocardioides psychrotolerans]|uniref:Amidohydrolase n=1 Tax=Nocardioides psychrotolerans TaxID=1005945 RepID=A0A1I3BCP4_9ACTN|nr:amidohydrolase [Nocardioides psychrotolerans]GEP36714.1 amidohydrolase [Nocardioides psychrotolerans]SFH60065.1 amidohydrolase [Nocardioides psychrotolerans]
MTETAAQTIASVVDEHDAELVGLRRDLHLHPELSWSEHRTTDLVAARLEAAGWRVTRTPETGLVAELGTGRRVVALRADMDALPVQDVTGEPWASSVAGLAHACGHDVHVAALVGAALALAQVVHEHPLDGRVRLLLQPAEEVMPGGALHLIAQGVLDDVEQIFALHCDPAIDVGSIGLRTGSLTSAADRIEVRLAGTGGHTSRPHLTGDLTFALAKVTTELPAVLSRRMDPRAGVSVVWGIIQAGSAANVIPDRGLAAGTVRILDAVAWHECEQIVRDAIHDLVRPYGVTATVDYQRGVPPVVNDAGSIAVLAAAVREGLGPEAQVGVLQSLGGEDFGWYLDTVPGAMFRLGTRARGGPTYELHQGNLRVDERAIGIGARILAGAAVTALGLAGR